MNRTPGRRGVPDRKVFAGIVFILLSGTPWKKLPSELGYDKHDPVGYNIGNSRNGTRPKTVLTDAVGGRSHRTSDSPGDSSPPIRTADPFPG